MPACAEGKPEVVKERTPLMLACAKGKPEVVKVLLDYGADVTQKEKKPSEQGQEKTKQEQGLNSLELAIESGHRYIHTYVHVSVHVYSGTSNSGDFEVDNLCSQTA